LIVLIIGLSQSLFYAVQTLTVWGAMPRQAFKKKTV